MAEWLGIAILVVFSLGLNAFMRHERRETQRAFPAHLGRWVRDATVTSAGTYFERRALVVNGNLLRKTRLIEQRRERRVSDGEILQVFPERTLDAWR